MPFTAAQAFCDLAGMEWASDLHFGYQIVVDDNLFTRVSSEKDAIEVAFDVKQRLPASTVRIRNARTGYEVEVPGD